MLLYGSELLGQPVFRENILPVMFEDFLAPVLWIIRPASTTILHCKYVKLGMRSRENSQSTLFCVLGLFFFFNEF